MSFFDKMEEPIMVIGEKLNNNTILKILRDAFMLAFPLTIFGSITLVIANLPFLDKLLGAEKLAILQNMLNPASAVTMSIATVFIVLGIGYYFSKDQEAVDKCLEKGYEFPEITSWIRASKKDFQLVKELGLKETGVLVSCSDYHIFHKMHMTRHQAVGHYIGIVRECIETGVRPRCHFEDITRADFYGFVVPFAMELMNLMEETGVPVKIRACDTLGYGITYPGAVLPRSVPGIIYGLRHHAGVPANLLEWHGHNDFYRAVNNASYAWLYGASTVNCSLLGIGERTGNTPLEAMVMEYAQIRGTLNGMDTRVITEIAEYYEKELGYTIPPMTPFVGKNFNVTRAGIHADGILKNEEIYNIFDTEKLLDRPVRIAISNTSGTSGIAHWINTYFHLKGQAAVSKTDDVVNIVYQWVNEQYNEGRVTVITDEELERVTLRAMEQKD